MSDAQMLEALVRRAVENGADLKLSPLSIPDYVRLLSKGSPWIEQLFYGSHDFARALFGDEDIAIERPMLVGRGKRVNLIDKVIAYQFRLQQAVVSDNPIRYMYNAVFEGKPVYPPDDPH